MSSFRGRAPTTSATRPRSEPAGWAGVAPRVAGAAAACICVWPGRALECCVRACVPRQWHTAVDCLPGGREGGPCPHMGGYERISIEVTPRGLVKLAQVLVLRRISILGTTKAMEVPFVSRSRYGSYIGTQTTQSPRANTIPLPITVWRFQTEFPNCSQREMGRYG